MPLPVGPEGLGPFSSCLRYTIGITLSPVFLWLHLLDEPQIHIVALSPVLSPAMSSGSMQ